MNFFCETQYINFGLLAETTKRNFLLSEKASEEPIGRRKMNDGVHMSWLSITKECDTFKNKAF